MSIIRKIILSLYGLIAIAGGMFLILTSRGIIFDSGLLIQSCLSRVNPDSLFFGGSILLVGGLLPVLLKVAELRRSRYVAFDNPDGEVAIALGTIEDFVDRVGKSFPEVIQAKPVIVPRRKRGVEITMEVILAEGANIPRLTETMQHQIKSQLQELLGIENIAMIQINVSKIAPRPPLETP